MTASLLDITALSDDALNNLRIYWHRRLYSRGGSWLAMVMKIAAEEQLAEINAELARRKHGEKSVRK